MRHALLACGIVCMFAAGCNRAAKAYLQRGNILFAAAKYEEASLNYRKALQKDAQSDEAYYRLSLALLKLGRNAEAYQMLKCTVALSPRNTDAKIRLADLSLIAYSGNPAHPPVLYNQARTLTEQLLGADPNSADALRLQGSIFLIDHHVAEAIMAFRSALLASPKSPEIGTDLAGALFRNNEFDDGERTVQSVLAQHPDFAPGYDLLYAYYARERRWADGESLLKTRAAHNPNDPEAVIHLAAHYYKQRKPDLAESSLNTLLDRRNVFPHADLLIGDFHAATKNWERALADYQRGELQDPTRKVVYQTRAAAILTLVGRKDDALRTIEELLRWDPKNTLARLLKAQLLLQLGGMENARAAAGLAAAVAKEVPHNSRVQMIAGKAYMAANEWTAAAAALEMAAKAAPASAAPKMELARLALLKKDYETALRQADTALRIQPHDVDARLLHVAALTAKKSYPAARAEALQLLREQPGSRSVELELGIIALKEKRYSEAEARFRNLYKPGDSDPGPITALVSTYIAENQPDRALELLHADLAELTDGKSRAALLAATATAAGKSEEALTDLARMAAAAPNSAEIQIRIGQLRLERGDLKRALAALQRAKEIEPRRQGIDPIIAELLGELGRRDEAIAAYRSALSSAPEDPIVLNNLAFLLAERASELDQALGYVQTALRKAPNYPAFLDTLAWIYIKQGHVDSAIAILSSLVKRVPERPSYHYHFATALVRRGDRPSAQRELQLALSNKPDDRLQTSIRGLLNDNQLKVP